jgi:preprotein translocase subunit SecF
MRFFQNANYDFMKYRRHWAVVSTILSLVGLSVILLHQRLNVGIDFAGGTQVVVQFKQAPHADQLRDGLKSSGLGDVTLQRYGQPDSGQFLVRTRLHAKQEEQSGSEIMAALDKLYNQGQHPPFDLNQKGVDEVSNLLFSADPLQLAGADVTGAHAQYTKVAQEISNTRRQAGVLRDWSQIARLPDMSPEILQALQQRTFLGNYALLSRESVGPTVGSELRQRGILAVVMSMLAMLVYIWIRFELRFGVGAIVALIHDVLVTLGLYALFGFEFNLITIAAFLTLVGYSVNDSVVVFDRVRETLRKSGRRTSFEKLLNDSVNQTLSRTILTASSVFLAAVALFFLGGEVLRGFSFVMSVGVLVGTYSSVFVAASFALLWENMMAKRRAAQSPARAAEGGKAARESRPAGSGKAPERKVSAGGRRR